MNFFFKKNYLIVLCLIFIFLDSEANSKSKNAHYPQEDISNYFIGIVSANQDYTGAAFEHLNNVEFLKNKHNNFKVEYIRTLVLLEKFDQAFSFSKSIWSADEFFFEADLLLGLKSFLDKDYHNAEKYFKRLNKVSGQNFIFDDLFGNILISWMHASKNNKIDSFIYFDEIPDRYNNLKKIQNSLLHCYFNSSETLNAFNKLIEHQDYSFSRYNFFLSNYLLFNNKEEKAAKVIARGKEKHHTSLLLKQSEQFILEKKSKWIKSFYNCQNPKDNIAEFFYVIANLYSSEQDYQLSNFYLNISLLLNKKFTPNKTLLAENLFYQKKYKLSKKTYSSIKKIGSVYSWHASKNISTISLIISDKKNSISILKKAFDLIPNPNFEHYYDLANFYKDNGYYKESIKYYSLTLKNLKEDHFLLPKILDRRGTSYERIGEWDKAEKDLTESLRILPDQPYVLNYLAYSWIEKKINIDKALEMLKKAMLLKKNDGYIIDSLGWAYYANKNYIAAEKFLQKAVQLMPLDPVINDHYADSLWMLNKNIQARYFWKYVLNLDNTEEELKNSISDKLVFGVNKKS